MADRGSCHICGYEPKSDEEVRLWFQYGCARALITQRGDLNKSIELCSENRVDGGWYAPGTNPAFLKEDQEDEDALKEGIKHMVETNEALRKAAKEALEKKLDERDRLREERERQANENRDRKS